MKIKNKLSKVLKNRWIKALRSGEYKQGIGQLFNKADNSYCCLGIYCKVNDIKITNFGKDMDRKGYMPLNNLIGHDNVSKLWNMNDAKNYSFQKISEWIEKNL